MKSKKGNNKMNGFSILMTIFATCVLLVGLYAFTGHELGIFTMRPAFKNLKKEDWKNIGKWTIISSIFIYLIAILGLIFNI